MRVALLQIASPDDEGTETRRGRIDAVIRAEAALGQTDLIILPELWAVGCFHFDRYGAAAEPFDGPTLELARAWARLHDIHVHTGSFVEADGDDLHNTSAIVAPDGAVVAKYRKVHLFGSDEAQVMTPGATIDTADIDDFRLGLATCYDLRFPELFRSIVDAGVTAATITAAWPDARADHWRLFTTTRAVEEQMYVVACNAVGTQNGVALSGGSRVVDPWGVVVAEADSSEGFTYADIDAALPTRVRKGFPALADRRWVS